MWSQKKSYFFVLFFSIFFFFFFLTFSIKLNMALDIGDAELTSRGLRDQRAQIRVRARWSPSPNIFPMLLQPGVPSSISRLLTLFAKTTPSIFSLLSFLLSFRSRDI